jgi:hypothetical protein
VPTWADERAAVLAAINTWEEERASVLEAIVGLREWCETLSEQLAEVQKRPAHALYREMAQWGDAECAHIAEESQKREQEPLELPSLRSLRQN